jgi:WD40 repeat protein
LSQENPVGEFGKHPAAVSDLAVTPDGRLAVTSCEDHRLRFWEVSSGNLVGQCDLAQPITGASLSPEGELVAVVTSDGRLHLLECPTGKILKTAAFPETVFNPCHVAFAPDGRHLAVPGKEGKTLILRLER